MSDFKPGDVARVQYGDVDQLGLVRERKAAHLNGLEFAYVSGGFDMVGGVEQYARPLVVIDPEDREQVERIVAALEREMGEATFSATSRYLQVALRSLTVPPRPDEPQWLGAVVEDADGKRWVRVYSQALTRDYQCWKQEELTTRHRWSEIDAAKVLSEGVQP